LEVALPERRPIAAFYRQLPPQKIILRHQPDASVASAREFIGVGQGWTILPSVHSWVVKDRRW
jgi:hypothetical protein